jgi:hypothetical protein
LQHEAKYIWAHPAHAAVTHTCMALAGASAQDSQRWCGAPARRRCRSPPLCASWRSRTSSQSLPASSRRCVRATACEIALLAPALQCYDSHWLHTDVVQRCFVLMLQVAQEVQEMLAYQDMEYIEQVGPRKIAAIFCASAGCHARLFKHLCALLCWNNCMSVGVALAVQCTAATQ